MSRLGCVMSRPGRLLSRLMGMEQRDTDTDFLEETLRMWQPHADGRLTDDDAREIISNVAGFFRVLVEWDRDARGEESSDTVPNVEGGGKPV